MKQGNFLKILAGIWQKGLVVSYSRPTCIPSCLQTKGISWWIPNHRIIAASLHTYSELSHPTPWTVTEMQRGQLQEENKTVASIPIIQKIKIIALVCSAEICTWQTSTNWNNMNNHWCKGI